MSGGFFDYEQYKIDMIADQIEGVIRNNDSTELNEWGNPVSRELQPQTILYMQAAVDRLRRAAIYAQRIDWMLSGDDSEESFWRYLEEELQEYDRQCALKDQKS